MRAGLSLVFLLPLFLLLGCGVGVSTAKVGEQVELRVEKSSQAGDLPVADSQETNSEFLAVLKANDEYGYQRLFALGRMYRVKNGTKALVLERTHTLARVRILDGNYQGRDGWLPVEFVVKAS